MNPDTFSQIAEALRAVASLLDEAANDAARAAAAQPELPVAPVAQQAYCNDPDSCGCPHHDDCVALKAAPEGIAPPADQVPAPGAASTDVSTAAESSALAPAPAAEEPAPAPATTYEDVKAALFALMHVGGAQAAKDVLKAFGCGHLREAKPEEYERIIMAADEARRMAEIDDESGEGAW